MKKYFVVFAVVVVALALALVYYGGSTGERTGAEVSSETASRGVPDAHPPTGARKADVDNMDFSGIDVPEGGTRIADLYADKTRLDGRQVVVRGKVVRFTPGVLDKNWIHLRDGTGTEGTNDLTVTTDAEVAVGDVVVARGVLSLDREFGTGRVYEVFLEDAEVTLE